MRRQFRTNPSIKSHLGHSLSHNPRPIPLAQSILPLIRANPANPPRTFHLALDQGKSNVLLKHFHALSDACVDPSLTHILG